MKVYIIVHGAVQGVGYRAFVKGIADRYSIKGFAKNEEDGSVHILADSSKENLLSLLHEIDVDTKYGPQVFMIEVYWEGNKGFPDDVPKEHQTFEVIHSHV